MRVLYVEDSAILRRSVRRALRHAGYAVDTAADGEDGLALAQGNNYDAVVLDIMLPKLDGLAILARLRAAGNGTHVLLLTARDTVTDRVEGLRRGADDYLVKPFALDELLARVEALCRRAYGGKTSKLCIGPLEIDLAARHLRCDGDAIELTAREWRLLEYLALRRGEVVARAEIEAHIYDERAEPLSNVVDAAVYGLRRKIGAHLIQTRRGLGYVLAAPEP
ncbi:MAG: response regulator transcription factor [Chthoniobacterales bacterium]